ncbi:MAG: NarK family nitrate/nitrite MFS transporter [Opitutaceae bacterium]|nr:NarK family nitrate/nitrite MFS transporter [Cytophagales bacterium]
MKDIMMQKAEKINLFSANTIQMRVFHITWLTFFLCFFGWFGIAPLMPVVRDELHLTKGQIGNIMISSVAITIFARLLIGWLCDKIGPRLCYTIVLAIGSIPVMIIGLSHSYESFLLFRLAIGVIGASFVITQYHTSVMFAPKIVGTANATVAGWGNLGGGVTQMVMPLIFAGFIGLGYTQSESWRIAMVIPGFALLIMAFVYYKYTKDCPQGNVLELRKTDPEFRAKAADVEGSFKLALKDYRVWILFLAYGCSFGMEITMDNVAALYFVDNFKLDLQTAGIFAGLFACMNLFARALGGIVSDKLSGIYGMRGRTTVLALCILLEGFGIMLFTQMQTLSWAVVAMIGFALFIKMANGATYSIVPFVNTKALGSVAGIVGAGGNLGAVFFAYLLKNENASYQESLYLIGTVIAIISLSCLFLNFEKKQVVEKKTVLA